MSREIKFRAWDKNRNQMITDFVLAPTSPHWSPFLIRRDETVDALVNAHYKQQGDLLGGDYTMLDWSDWYGIDNLIVMQYTGLKDKNGKEIYEGDIVRALIDFGPGGTPEMTFAVTMGPFGVNIQEWVYREGKFPEVIGNIYENPELLKK